MRKNYSNDFWSTLAVNASLEIENYYFKGKKEFYALDEFARRAEQAKITNWNDDFLKDSVYHTAFLRLAKKHNMTTTTGLMSYMNDFHNELFQVYYLRDLYNENDLISKLRNIENVLVELSDYLRAEQEYSRMSLVA